MKTITSYEMAINLKAMGNKPVRISILGYSSDDFSISEAFGRIVISSKHTILTNTTKKQRKQRTSEEAI